MLLQLSLVVGIGSEAGSRNGAREEVQGKSGATHYYACICDHAVVPRSASCQPYDSYRGGLIPYRFHR